MPTVLSTKILEPLQKKRIIHAGIGLVEQNFIHTKCIDFELNGPLPNLIFSSSLAVEAFQRQRLQQNTSGLMGQSVFCVGEKTAALLRSYQADVRVVELHAKALAQRIANDFSDQDFVFCAGQIHRPELPRILNQHSIHCEIQILYHTHLQPHRIARKFDGLLFYSPSGVHSYLHFNTLDEQSCFCLGTTTAAALPQNHSKIHIATKPTIEHLIARVIQQLKNTA